MFTAKIIGISSHQKLGQIGTYETLEEGRLECSLSKIITSPDATPKFRTLLSLKKKLQSPTCDKDSGYINPTPLFAFLQSILFFKIFCFREFHIFVIVVHCIRDKTDSQN